MANHRRLAVVGAALALALVLPGIASATHSWGGYHWARTANPFTLKVGDNVSGLWDGMFDTSIADWTSSTVLNLSKVAGGARPKTCRPTSGRVEVCNARYGNTGWLGVAQIWITGGVHITQGTVKNNDTYFGTSNYQYNNTAEMQHVICQEIGHTFGLDHQSEDGTSLNTCMDYYHNTSDQDTKSTHPNAGDYDELLCIYDATKAGQTLTSPNHTCRGTGHLDATSTIGSAPAAANPNANAASSASAWGRLTASSRSGKEQTFVLDLGSGRSIVTFVIWA